MSVPISYSFKDLMLDPTFKESVKGLWEVTPETMLLDLDLKVVEAKFDKELMEKCFYEVGIDTSQPYQIIHCNHRTRLSNEPWEGLMVIGEELLTKEWLNSGYASYEAKIHTNDPFLRETLKGLDPNKMKRELVGECVYDEGDCI